MDPGLVERARDGDREAYEFLVRKVARPLYLVAHRILRDADLAEDALQQTLISMWRELPRLRDPDRFDAWTYRLIVRASLEESRRRGRHAHVRELPSTEPSAPDTSAAFATRDLLEDAFRRLTPEHRAVVVLHHYVGMSLGEVAQTLGIPYGTAGSRLHYALRELRTTLDGDEQRAIAQGRTT